MFGSVDAKIYVVCVRIGGCFALAAGRGWSRGAGDWMLGIVWASVLDARPL